jgi:hypothetical protein
VKSDYISNLFQLNELKNYEDSRGDFEGIIRNVLDSGHLVIERNGEAQHYGLKEIVFKL